MKKNQKIIKNLRSKMAIFLAIVFVLNIAPLPENTGRGITPFIVNSLSNLQQAVGTQIKNVFAEDTQEFFLKEAGGGATNFEVNLSRGGETNTPYELKTDTAYLLLKV